MDVLVDLLLNVSGLRVIFYGVVVSTFALGVLCMTVLVVGYAPTRWHAPARARRSVRGMPAKSSR